jgi:hypothetical protein
MDHADTNEVELDTEIEAEAVPLAEPEHGSAAEAFARLEGEMALMRRAVEHLAAERADIIIPDYGTTLGEMAGRLAEMSQSLAAIAIKPALQFTPKSMAERIEAAAREARRTDHDQLAEARKDLYHATQDMRGLVGRVHAVAEQRRRLAWMGGGGLLAGIILWSFLPGMIVRSMPTNWHWPERLATRMLEAPSPWDAGVRLMRAGSPEAWSVLVQAADMQRDNRETIADCQKTAGRTGKPVRCTLEIRPKSQP